MRPVVVFCFVCIFLRLYGTEHSTASVAPPIICNGSVNVITGEYVEAIPQIILRSPFQLGLTGSYLSPWKRYDGRSEKCWQMGGSHMTYNQQHPNEVSYPSIIVDTPSGLRRVYNQEGSHWSAETGKKRGEAAANLSMIDRIADQDGGFLFLLREGNLERLYYSSPLSNDSRFMSETGKRSLPLTKVERSNGETIEISYHDKVHFDRQSLQKLMELRSGSGELLGWIQHHYPSDKLEQADFSYAVTGSDGQRVSYEISNQQLTAIRRPGHPSVKYEYATPSGHSELTPQGLRTAPRLVGRREGRFFLRNSYYEKGRNYIGNDKIDLKSARVPEGRVEHPSIHCVKEQFAPVGEHENEEISIARYYYHFDPSKNLRPYQTSGYTDVCDATQNLTRFQWTEGEQITSVQRFQGLNQLLMQEIYLYNKDSAEPVGKVLFDRTTPTMAITLEHNPSGCVISEKLWGNLTGKSVPLELDDHGFPKENGIDCICREFVYTEDNRLSEERCGSLRTCYTYHPSRDLIASIAVYNETNLLQLLTLAHDENGILVQEERTCGSTTYTTKIEPIATGPAIGFPRRVEEYANGDLIGAIEWTYGLYNLPASETYFDANNCPCYTLTTSYDEGGRPIRTTDPEGHQVVITYDQWGNLASKQGPRPESLITYKHDHANRLIEQTSHLAKSKELTQRYRYDWHHQLKETTDPYGQTTSFRRNALGEVIGSRQCNGTQNGSKCNYARDVFGNCTQVTSELGAVESHQYTIRGQIAESRYADGTSESYTYDLMGRLIQKVDRLNITTTATYDALGHLLSIEERDRDGHQGRKLYLTYDGDLAISTSDGELETAFEYDSAGKLIKIRSGERLTEFGYDSLGRQTRQIVWFGGGCNDHIDTVWEYDLSGRVQQERLEDWSGKIWKRVEYTHDAAGNILSVTTYGERGVPEASLFEYDSLNRLVRSIDPLGHPTTYTYDEAVCCTDALGYTTRQHFDQAGRLNSMDLVDPEGTILAKVEYSFGLAGRLAEERHLVLFDGKEIDCQATRYTYGPCGRLEAIHEEMGKTTRFQYNKLGQCVVKTLPSGDCITYEYNSFGHLLHEQGPGFEYHYVRDSKGNILSAKGSDGITTRTYDLYGQLIEERLSNGLSLAHRYDRAGRLLSTTLPDHSCVEYTHDPIGVSGVRRGLFSREILARDLSGRPLAERGGPGGLKWSHRWDQAGRLVESRSPQGIVKLQYDKLNRLISTHDSAGSCIQRYGYDGLSYLTEESGDWKSRWRYDSLGNRREINGVACLPDRLNRCNGGYNANHQVQNIDGNACDYDGRGRLVLLNDTSGQGWRYTYDCFDRRVRESFRAGSVTEERRYLYDNEIEIGRIGASETELRLMMDCGGRAWPHTVGMDLNGELFSAVTSSRGDITAVVDATGRCLENMRYSAFGKQSICGESISPWGFSGKRHDPSGFVYFGRRYYSPAEGRWLSPDPLGSFDGPNLYQYCHNNPFFFADWLGLAGESFVFGGGGYAPDYMPPQTDFRVRVADYDAVSFQGTITGGSFGGFGNPAQVYGFDSFNNMVNAMGAPSGGLRAAPQRSWEGTIGGWFQMVGGAVEVYLGGLLCSSGVGIPLGLVLAAHGFDHAFAGAQTVWHGQSTKTLTCQSLEMAGVPTEWADATDFTASIVLTMGGSAVYYSFRVGSAAMLSRQATRAMEGFSETYRAPIQVAEEVVVPRRVVSLYEDVTRAGSKFPNRATDVTMSQFERNLINSGFTRSLSRDGKVAILEKQGVRYILRDGAKSTGGPTADFYKPGHSAIDLKIRLE
jgi:RHS repeat-associated protein